MLWTLVSKMNEMDYGLKEMNEMDYNLKEIISLLNNALLYLMTGQFL